VLYAFNYINELTFSFTYHEFTLRTPRFKQLDSPRMTREKSRPNGKRTPQSVWGSKRSCNIERNEVETPLVVKQRSGIRFLSRWFIRVIRHSFLTSNNRQVWVEEEWQVLECHKTTVTHPPPTVRQQRYLFPDLWTTLLSIACCTAWAVIVHFSERGRNQLCSKILYVD
jgi:hypothetical protein